MLSFRNAWTNLHELFFVGSVFGMGWFSVQKNPDLWSGFSGKIRKKPDNCNFHSISCQIVLKFLGKILLVAMRTNKKIFVCPPSNKKNLSWKFQLNLTTYTMKIAIIRFFPDFSGKTGPQIRIFLDRKSPHTKDGANKKKFSQIGPGVPEWEHKPFYGFLWSSSRPPKLH